MIKITLFVITISIILTLLRGALVRIDHSCFGEIPDILPRQNVRDLLQQRVMLATNITLVKIIVKTIGLAMIVFYNNA